MRTVSLGWPEILKYMNRKYEEEEHLHSYSGSTHMSFKTETQIKFKRGTKLTGGKRLLGSLDLRVGRMCSTVHQRDQREMVDGGATQTCSSNFLEDMNPNLER